MNVRLIEEKVPVGSEVSFFLRTGQEFRGELTEIGKAHVCLEGSSRDSVVMTDMICAWNVHSGETHTRPENAANREKRTPPPPSTPLPGDISSPGPEIPQQDAPTQSPSYIKDNIPDVEQEDPDKNSVVEKRRERPASAPAKKSRHLFKKVKGFFNFKKISLEDLKRKYTEPDVKKWLENYETARKTGDFHLLDSVVPSGFFIEAEALPISAFLEFYLENCKFLGVDASHVEKGVFSEEDLKKLETFIESDENPGLKNRAQYNLSAAKIMVELDVQDEVRRRHCLGNFAADMGDAYIEEEKIIDIARAFYSEAISIAPVWSGELRARLCRLVLMYWPDEKIRMEEEILEFEVCLKHALVNNKGKHPPNGVVEKLLQASAQNYKIDLFILPAIFLDPNLRKKVSFQCRAILETRGKKIKDFREFSELWSRARNRVRLNSHEIADEMTRLQALAPSLESTLDQNQMLDGLKQKLNQGLNQTRLRWIHGLLNKLHRYVHEEDYQDQERTEIGILNKIKDMVDEIEAYPSIISLELFRPYLLSIKAAVEKNFKDVQRDAESDHLVCCLATESYCVPEDGGEIECRMVVTNPAGKSPVNSICLRLDDSISDDISVVDACIRINEELAGGAGKTVTAPFKVLKKVEETRETSLYCRLCHTTRRNKKIETDNQKMTIRLHPAEKYKISRNPYALHSEGGAVTNKDMFFGRWALIEKLLSHIHDSKEHTNTIIYGQKRSGKSSILHHLKQQLVFPIVPVSFSMMEILSDFTIHTFLHIISQDIENEFENLEDDGKPPLSIEAPSADEFTLNPEVAFFGHLSRLMSAISKTPEYDGVKIILLIDEFSDIFIEMERGAIQSTFMKLWRGLLDKKYFSTVLIGQDFTPRFIEHFKNEFGVVKQERISYLDEENAKDLMISPIRIPGNGENRFQGAALERLYELTAGSAFYIQIFCDRLVHYLKRKKAVFITETDIEAVKDGLIKGHNSLTIDKFDNLINSGDEGEGVISDQDARDVLDCIALVTRTEENCPRFAIICNTTHATEEILEDLLKREVIKRKKEKGEYHYRIIVGLFKEWLLVNSVIKEEKNGKKQ